MSNKHYEMNPHLLERYLKKPSKSFTKQDIINYVLANDIEMINFRYVADDGKLKSLNFIIQSEEHLNEILTTGERVDGSSLLKFIGTGSSDLYVVPRYNTAFVNPFEEIPSLDILCYYFDFQGKLLEAAPENVLRKANEEFVKATGLVFKGFGELEYYIIAEKEDNQSFPAVDQRGYHEAEPFAKYGFLRKEAMQLMAQCGCKIKYGHSEVGNFSDDKFYYEQQEIEFSPCEPEEAANQLIIAKWILRQLCDDYGVGVSFAPKITVGKAGSGLHIHMMLEDKNGKNIMVKNDKLSDEAKKMIAGILDLSDALTAFGNTIPTAYLRLVPHQEAPTNICWGDRNRSVLIRVPLGWIGGASMIETANPQDKSKVELGDSKQTVEIRSGDGSADIYLYLAGILVAAQHGLTMANSLDLADKLYVNVNIFDEENKERLAQLNGLPISCYESAAALENKREFFEANDVFQAGLIDNVAKKLRSFEDDKLSEKLYGKHDEIYDLVMKYIHCM